MRYMVNGKDATKAEYDSAPAGVCKAVTSAMSALEVLEANKKRAEEATK